MRNEAGRLLDHTDRHRGRIDIADARLRFRFLFRRVTLGKLPTGWAAEARTIVTHCRPLAANTRQWATPVSENGEQEADSKEEGPR
ncbi:hypothetical protein [Streptomyces telluris]|uniref:Uncharacterized protein n=1 Tax=Streptomyces telluris TaxID=2720021 RepID=A0A9X2LFN1_9ACTN|nr:hypothetical protein [Streptomyces telluris]MCQ8770432.1 hypothetical protein [Streptomyces telluris]